MSEQFSIEHVGFSCLQNWCCIFQYIWACNRQTDFTFAVAIYGIRSCMMSTFSIAPQEGDVRHFTEQNIEKLRQFVDERGANNMPKGVSAVRCRCNGARSSCVETILRNSSA